LSVYGSGSVNTFSPSFRLDVDHLLHDVAERDDEVSQVSQWHSLSRRLTRDIGSTSVRERKFGVVLYTSSLR